MTVRSLLRVVHELAWYCSTARIGSLPHNHQICRKNFYRNVIYLSEFYGKMGKIIKYRYWVLRIMLMLYTVIDYQLLTMYIGTNLLTECIHTRQTLMEMAKSRNLMTMCCVNQLMGRVNHTKYFWPGVTLILMGAHPNFEVAKKN